MTLATETIKQWRSDAENIARRSCEYETEYSAAEAILALTAELLANREAQPVALVDRRPAASGSICWQNGGKDLAHGTELFTAPPAPAVNASQDFEAWFVEKYKQPERLMKNGDGAYKFCGIQMAFSAWIDGRAAMLAQPVSSGYKLVPVEPTENMIIDGFESDAFMALADAVNEKNSWPYGCRESAECVEGIFKAMLAAAPEGGNG
ncbi:hypothetical protein PTR02_23360 [Serratia nevei]|uniref:hypothetical protein n=1 Tax=Serratia nevei TaxID=2703794 RepID=UPI00313DD022